MQNTKKNYALRSAMLLTLVLLLSGCAQTSRQYVAVSPTLPERPSLSTPLPSQTYSQTASKRIESWQRRLTDTLPISD